ncbi:hypothetical protein [Cohnella rhizosphaerae]|uniref:Uncharacterized protein n=1 Tax=Cohnella rhizosphaerae TaxID=1457232 RepID=A0A9X4QX41_9BACL|nr:hypothetical protein [Cohnella rhizosphaerae]MDG0814450.1 hypothetical protein [Cohnella rhizosphaerae]
MGIKIGGLEDAGRRKASYACSNDKEANQDAAIRRTGASDKGDAAE